jgi:hypothetical protein
VLVGASRAVENAGDDPAIRARIITIMLDGLRPPAEPHTGRSDSPLRERDGVKAVTEGV